MEDVREKFVIRGKEYEISREDILKKARELTPERVNHWFVEIEGKRFPVKQIVCETLGIERIRITTADAVRILEKLGFEPKRI